MQTGMGSRENPLLVIITTAGFDKEAPCFRVERANAVQVLKGQRTQDNLFAMIFTLDEGDDWQDEKVWKKANPNLGSTPTVQYLRDQVKDAMNKGASTRVQVLTKNFNIWMDAPKVWIPEEQIKAVCRPIDISEFYDRDIYLGLDLSATTDLTALALFIPGEEEAPAKLKVLYWLPENTVEKRNDVAPYREWSEQGHINLTAGNVVDYSAIKATIYDLQQKARIIGVGYDQWNAYETTAELSGNDINMEKVLPHFGWQSNPTKRLEMMVVNGEIEIDNNPVLLWNFRNVMIIRNAEDQIKVNKGKSAEKVDGIAASVDAIYVWLQEISTPSTGSYLFEDESELITI